MLCKNGFGLEHELDATEDLLVLVAVVEPFAVGITGENANVFPRSISRADVPAFSTGLNVIALAGRDSNILTESAVAAPDCPVASLSCIVVVAEVRKSVPAVILIISLAVFRVCAVNVEHVVDFVAETYCPDARFVLVAAVAVEAGFEVIVFRVVVGRSAIETNVARIVADVTADEISGSASASAGVMRFVGVRTYATCVNVKFPFASKYFASTRFPLSSYRFCRLATPFLSGCGAPS